MSKQPNPSRTKSTEARAYSHTVRSSPRKLNIVAAMIRGKSAEKAMIDLEFCHRRIAKDVRKVLQAAVSNAENNHNLNVDRLVVVEASVGRTMSMRRFHARGRGKATSIEKPFSNLTIVVGEDAPKPKAEKVKDKVKTKAAPATKGETTKAKRQTKA